MGVECNIIIGKGICFLYDEIIARYRELFDYMYDNGICDNLYRDGYSNETLTIFSELSGNLLKTRYPFILSLDCYDMMTHTDNNQFVTVNPFKSPDHNRLFFDKTKMLPTQDILLEQYFGIKRDKIIEHIKLQTNIPDVRMKDMLYDLLDNYPRCIVGKWIKVYYS